ncbi:tetratricopeptide repeat-containing sensor histidine kinase [Constantimarinum furrinae]|uniref:Two-component system sensor kinase n=1 Tax=Constantimarinum furrinae TaxID=2562285 RepID=A0A7G8PU37_9FLAO|nr:histidine kinase [Constantimarinum furrinae]QNJ97853.1 two-component system sensor kinase [Constantimarinum furrinae]
MKHLFSISILIVVLLGSSFVSGQTRRTSPNSFILKGKVVEAESNSPINRVNIEILGGDYATTNADGQFRIEAEIGDELIIKSDDFETVYYKIKDQQFVTVRVKNNTEEESVETLSANKNKSSDLFKTYIDSSRFYLKKDAKRSIEYITRALESVPGKTASPTQNSIAFETLGDINSFWGQDDLAISNYKRSISNKITISARIKLASAFRRNNNYQEGITLYKNLLAENLTEYQKVEVYEGLGDSYKAINNLNESVSNYQKALNLAEKHRITPKITDLNSKMGSVYAESGSVVRAEEYFDNSLNLAQKENKKRAVEEKDKVADFYNQNQDFDKEIQLRNETLNEIQSLDDFGTSGVVENSSPLTPQRQNYKIANAYVAQQKFTEAIPFLEKSIREASKNEDLVVEKDATRKLSEVYRDIGDFDKAAESYERYVEVVDELYIKKEQEISQAARFSKDIALKQNRITNLESERELNESRYKLAFENQELVEKNNRIQKWIIGSLILIALLLLFTAYIQYKNVRQQKYANNLLALKSLRTQMNPHFIFNALNSVNSFIASNDERTANKYLSDFSQLMRAVLENSEEDFISLEKEIELLQLYVKLEHFRFKDKFDYTIDVDPNIAVNEFVIPPMLLQPYVENAVWHGLRYKEEKGNLTIQFQQINSETVKIRISDDGIGRKKSKELKTDHQKKQNSKGMGNIEKRIAILNEMYKDKVDVTVTNIFENEEGTLVELILKKD